MVRRSDLRCLFEMYYSMATDFWPIKIEECVNIIYSILWLLIKHSRRPDKTVVDDGIDPPNAFQIKHYSLRSVTLEGSIRHSASRVGPRQRIFVSFSIRNAKENPMIVPLNIVVLTSITVSIHAGTFADPYDDVWRHQNFPRNRLRYGRPNHGNSRRVRIIFAESSRTAAAKSVRDFIGSDKV